MLERGRLNVEMRAWTVDGARSQSACGSHGGMLGRERARQKERERERESERESESKRARECAHARERGGGGV